MSSNKLERLVVISVLVIIAIMLLAPFSTGLGGNATPSQALKTSTASTSNAPASPSTPTNWTYPTNTMQEPGYTNGTYTVGATNNVGHLNEFRASSLYSFLLLDEIYDSPVQTLPNGTDIPWLATSWNYSVYNKTTASPTQFTGNNTTFDPVTGAWTSYSVIWTVHIRQGVQWTDYNNSNAAQTYTYKNTLSANNTTGAHYTHTFRYANTKMQTHTVQAADFVWSWLMLQGSTDFSGSYQSVVNVEPTSNTTVQYFLSSQSATFTTYTLGAPILPYHIWGLGGHNFSTIPGQFNYMNTSAAAKSTNGYNNWNLNYTSSGFAPGLVGTGPFMMNGGYGMPKGYEVQNQGWKLFVNPHYFIQYINNNTYRQYTPKIYSLYFPFYTSISNAVTAELKGQIDTITQGVTPNFVPTVLTMPNTYIYHKPSSGYGYMQLNSFASNAPFNITQFRQALNYATDKAYLASVVSSGYDVLGQPLIPTSDPLWRNDSTPGYSYNPQKAIALIKAIPGMTNHSGVWYYNGNPVKANIQITSAASNPIGVEGALLIQKWWTAVGVPTSVTQETFTTLVPNLLDYNYNVISLGITGISGDPTGDYFAFYNQVLGNGTGFYLGPFSSLTASQAQSVGLADHSYTGKQINSYMNNLTIELNTITNLSQRLAISKQIQGIAAVESTMINFGYPIDILEFTNTTYVNISRTNALPYSGYMWYAFETTHKRASPLTTSYTSHLEVNVTTSSNILYNGQYANLTITVKDSSSGNPVSGASLFVGVNPAGALLNITSNSLTTNSKGQANYEFQVLNTQPLIYAPDYLGAVNLSVVATSSSSSVGPGLSSVLVNVLPHSVRMQTSNIGPLEKGGAPQKYTITLTNEAGNPISGFQYNIESLTGAVVIAPTSSSQTVTTGTSPYVSVNNTKMYNDNQITSISGTTGSNGTIVIMVSANSTFNFGASGNIAESYLFFGDIISGATVTGAPGYMLPAEWTTANNANDGFGTQQPIELPVEISNGAPAVKITVTSSSTDMNFNGSITFTATVTNATSGKPIAGYEVEFLAQNALGANRGYFVNSNGTDVLAPNPNSGFGSVYIPGLTLKTDSQGKASATFYPYLYTYSNASSPSFQKQAYQSSSLVPADMWVITVMGDNSTSLAPLSSMMVYSAASIHHVAPPAAPFNYTYVVIGVVAAAVVIIGVAVVLSRRGKA